MITPILRLTEQQGRNLELGIYMFTTEDIYSTCLTVLFYEIAPVHLVQALLHR